MKVLVTGVGGQLGHDVMNELARRGHQGVGSDIAPVYSGIADGSAVTKAAVVSSSQMAAIFSRRARAVRWGSQRRLGPTP